ncbi:MAG: transcription-repair coupling factor [Bacteroidetes bacterium]|nr:transcription-repair coupling factor [Bacteroidota bacterium]
MAAMAHKLPGHHHLVVAHSHDEALLLSNDLETLMPEGRVMVFPSPYYRHQFVEAFDSNQIQQRTEVLERFSKNLSSPHMILTYPEALLEKVVSKAQVAANTFMVKVGDGLDLDFITDFLIEYQFERVDFVYEPGTFSLRGGIVDVFSFAAEMPFRIELFGDKVESIKQFDPETQLSERRLQSVHLMPNFEHEAVASAGRVGIMDYLPDDMVVWSQGIRDQVRALDTFEERVKQVSATAPSSMLQAIRQMIAQQDLLEAWKARRVVDLGAEPYFGDCERIQFHFQPQPVFNKRFDLLADKLEENDQAGLKTYIFSDSKTQLERIYAILDDIGRHPVFEAIYHGLHQGFVDKDLKLACYTEHEIFNRYKKPKGRKSYNQEKAITLKELYQLQPGDYVVHIDHGIGQFSGLEKMEINGKEQEAIRLLYKGGDLLYINIHSLHKIARFTGQEGQVPTMHRLGGQAWNKLKEKTKGKVKDIARDLIKLYAARKSQPGFAFSPDGYLQYELEASFIYEDTPDQAKATADVKADMEQPHPMDRLVCGDVGFGKTEVAIRAAFKAAVDGKQAAVLVPTTVLALQHFKTFTDRLSDLPVTVDYINRFKSDGQVKVTLEKVAEGKVDILVGTHRLLSSDVVFKDLGLLIVDEEQKFGVSAKEKIKALKVNVDTLTLTATPIPRTLQFSLMGARDLSTINTPPPNRQPIDTLLHVWDEGILSEAVNRELARNGQVFFVHNRIADIFHFAGIIERLCPHARVAVAHGQMEGHKLEEIMVAFVDGFYDVLVSTSIIESGLDISNANTIIVNAAHNFGLSDLYQMRGRVGRSNKKAFCYLFTPPKHLLTETARKRLSAIEQHSDLGSGFQIAMRDMDIRGAGNILGAEQSGFIAEIGVEMYHKILNEALAELKESEFKDLFGSEAQTTALAVDCQIDTDMTLLIPDWYVTNINERMNLYRQLNDIDRQAKLDVFAAGLEDRFGPLPEPTANLLLTMQLKWQAQGMRIQKILLKSGKMFLNLPPQDNTAFYHSETFGRFLAYLQDHPKKVRLKQKDSGAQLVIDGVTNVRKALQCLSEIDVYEKVV